MELWGQVISYMPPVKWGEVRIGIAITNPYDSISTTKDLCPACLAKFKERVAIANQTKPPTVDPKDILWDAIYNIAAGAVENVRQN